ncbi:MAG: hypothetical protein COV30_00135 [Candidatus Yanofskybacteria bacterium CG10_big_fil_rev_8_21_14_0_10_37_15]|uniref:Uncharacterized protein n=1 Tax=Candidatus Yanofskybacteria bacterium CG10_big_fil_rev_8_21_14_0_10_37_15 TaxID=1975097 RepID=A0A2H0R6F3_9BACT|nr:MAG: hypothetical protein COV30_00135 [Candidatus Yanofskybacteria bacterium CG10_big_fil_rev_8_21_14_0_10_37_15]
MKFSIFKIKFSKFLPVLIIGLLFLPVFVSADHGVDDFSYLFHLYYDNGQLFADRDFEFVYDVVPETFVPETVNTQFPFKGEIITFSNQVAGTFMFDPRRGDPGFLKGQISVKAPYAPNGEKVVFYDAQGKQLLIVFVLESSFCNENGVCDVDNGEDQNTCSADCKGITPVSPIGNDSVENEQNGISLAIVYVLIGAGLLGGWFGWKRWKNKKENQIKQFSPVDLPPQQPLN